MAFQSVVLLMILTRTVGLVVSGIFTIAYASANLFLNVGKYGMRNYQVSDLKYEYSFKTYRASRLITSGAMILFSLIYVLIASHANGYTFEKSLIIMIMCLFKVPDAYEDVFYAEYQRRGRLDVGAKAMTLRLGTTTVLFAVTVIINHNLLISLSISTVFTYILLIYLLIATREIASVPMSDSETDSDSSACKSIWPLLYSSFPVFASIFMQFYIINSPKYAIDAQLSDDLQAIYGFIAMPVFVIGLLNNFIFTPLIYPLSMKWKESKIKEFNHIIIRQTGIIVAITLVCLSGAYLIGIPVLSILYNTDLGGYKAELLLILVGGGFLATSGIYMTVLTIMRRQTAQMIVYAVVSLVALFASSPVVRRFGIAGAVYMYDGLMAILSVIFIVMIIIFVRNHKNPSSDLSDHLSDNL